MSDWSCALSVPAADHAGDPTVLDSEARVVLRWSERRRLRFDLHWLHEASGGVLVADFGVPVRAPVHAEICCQLDGVLRTTVSLNCAGWVRFQLRNASAHPFAIACHAGLAEPAPAVDALLEILVGLPDLDRLLGEGLRSMDSFMGLPQATRSAVRAVSGRMDSTRAVRSVRQSIEAARSVRDRIYRATERAVETKRSAELATHLKSPDGQVLLDCSFRLNEEGLSRYRCVLGGDLSVALKCNSDVIIHGGRLSRGQRGQIAIELHLPLLERKWWNKRFKLFAGMSAMPTQDGRVMVSKASPATSVEERNTYQGALLLAGALPFGETSSHEGFTLAYCDRRRMPAIRAASALSPVLAAYGFDGSAEELLSSLPANSEVDAGVTLSIPGNAVASWLQVRRERTLDHYHGFIEVASAVQRALRTWLPYLYFQDLNRYDELELAYPLVVYQATKPFRRKMRNEYTYDPMTPGSIALAFRLASRSLPALLGSINESLLTAGKADTARLYSPERARQIVNTVRRDQRRFTGLIASDAFFVSEFVKLGNRARDLNDDLEHSPGLAAKKLTKFTAALTRSLHVRLRRLYGPQDYLSFAPLLFVEATRAISLAFGDDVPIKAVLRVGVETGREHIFLAARRAL